MTSLLTVSPSPHVRSGMTTQKIMLLVVLALVPAIVAATVVFGPRALFLVVFCAVISMFTEMVCQKLMQKETTYTDGSAMLTGVLLALEPAGNAAPVGSGNRLRLRHCSRQAACSADWAATLPTPPLPDVCSCCCLSAAI